MKDSGFLGVILKSFTSREFNQDVSQAKRIAVYEPVFVTDRGRPTHVLVSIDAYHQLLGPAETLVDRLAANEAVVVDFDWRSSGPWVRRG